MPAGPAWLRERYPSLRQVLEWLREIFPAGLTRRTWLTNPNAARTIFVMLYSLAIEGEERWLAPKAVVEMSDQQASDAALDSRLRYLERIAKPGARAVGTAWLAPNSREGIRDEAVRALKEVGAVIERPLPKTSSRGRYALTASFADLFDPARSDQERGIQFEKWREDHLSASELARVRILAAQVGTNVRLPDGTTRSLSPGPSFPILKAVIEEFAPRFLAEAVVLAYSDSAQPAAYVNEQLMADLGLVYRDVLPDVLLADIAQPIRFVFVEAVATEGPIDMARMQVLTDWLLAAGYAADDAYFITAYLDRGQGAFRSTIGRIAWHSAAWFATEPDKLLVASDGREIGSLRDLPGW